jgi:AmmeMemoRadiSam system protein A
VTQAVSIYAKLARKAILARLEAGRQVELPVPESLEPELQQPSACFVSLHLSNGNLRGCIGTIDPRYNSLFLEIVHNAQAAAFSDFRFEPLKVSEYDELDVSVDVLSRPVPIGNFSLLDPAVYGLIVSCNGSRKALLLPNIAGIDTPKEQVRILKRKAGVEHYPDHELNYSAFTATRFH